MSFWAMTSSFRSTVSSPPMPSLAIPERGALTSDLIAPAKVGLSVIDVSDTRFASIATSSASVTIRRFAPPGIARRTCPARTPSRFTTTSWYAPYAMATKETTEVVEMAATAPLDISREEAAPRGAGGAGGSGKSVAVAHGELHSLHPSSFCARTRARCSAPGDSPPRVWLSCEKGTNVVIVAPVPFLLPPTSSSSMQSSYVSTGSPPSYAGGDHATSMLDAGSMLPGAADTEVGVRGVSSVSRRRTGLHPTDQPAALRARMSTACSVAGEIPDRWAELASAVSEPPPYFANSAAGTRRDSVASMRQEHGSIPAS
mmetsp:Transcript_16385/g.53520  ORF Transcript_16385/g.53520 Transcript_16385/m.53520 type:complete len:315 (+) Transcript_16385:68-1012(+)